MSAWLRFAVGIVRGWAAVYTLGLPAELRRQRRAELASDAWEQTEASRASGVPACITAGRLLQRSLTGVPSDLAWRAQMASGAARTAALAGPTGLFDAGPAPRRQNGWLDRNGWAVPVLLVAIIIAAMLWLTHSSRPPRLDFHLEAAAPLAIESPYREWTVHTGCCSVSGHPTWLRAEYEWRFSIANTSPRTVSVALNGLDHLPDGVWLTLTAFTPGGEQEIHVRVHDGVANTHCYTAGCQHFTLPPQSVAPVRLAMDLRYTPALGAPRAVPLTFEVVGETTP